MTIIRLWERQIKDFRGFTWPTDQNGEHIKWEAPWLYLYGPTGTGKTTYARSWVDKWEGWEVVMCWSFADQLQMACDNQSSYKQHMNTIERAPRIVFDDLGSETEHQFTLMGRKHSKRTTASEVFETALEVRHRLKLRTGITSNLSPISHGGAGDLTTMLKDRKNWSSFQKKYGAKLHSRLVEVAAIYNLQGNRRPELAGVQPETNKTIEMISNPSTRSDVPLLPEAEGPLYEIEKPMTEREWQKAIRKAPAKIKPYMMKWHALWKKEKASGRPSK